MHVKITVFWDATLCSQLYTNYRFRENCSLYHQDKTGLSKIHAHVHLTTWHHIPPDKFLVFFLQNNTYYKNTTAKRF